MDYKAITTHNLTDLTVREISVIQAGLILLANRGVAGQISYPEYSRDAAAMLKVVSPAEDRNEPAREQQ